MQIEIINSYWSNETQGIESESKINEYLKNNTIEKVYLGDFKEIKNFEIGICEYKRFIIRYSLRGGNLKYYHSLLGCKIALYKNTLMCLYDCNFDNFEDFRNNILNKKTIDFLTSK